MNHRTRMNANIVNTNVTPLAVWMIGRGVDVGLITVLSGANSNLPSKCSLYLNRLE